MEVVRVSLGLWDDAGRPARIRRRLVYRPGTVVGDCSGDRTGSGDRSCAIGATAEIGAAEKRKTTGSLGLEAALDRGTEKEEGERRVFVCVSL